MATVKKPLVATPLVKPANVEELTGRWRRPPARIPDTLREMLWAQPELVEELDRLLQAADGYRRAYPGYGTGPRKGPRPRPAFPPETPPAGAVPESLLKELVVAVTAATGSHYRRHRLTGVSAHLVRKWAEEDAGFAVRLRDAELEFAAIVEEAMFRRALDRNAREDKGSATLNIMALNGRMPHVYKRDAPPPVEMPHATIDIGIPNPYFKVRAKEIPLLPAGEQALPSVAAEVEGVVLREEEA